MTGSISSQHADVNNYCCEAGAGQGQGQGRGQAGTGTGAGISRRWLWWRGSGCFFECAIAVPSMCCQRVLGVVDLLFIVKGKPLRGRCATLDYKQPIHCRGSAFDSPWREHETTF